MKALGVAATVIGERSAREVRELLGRGEVPPANLDAIHAELPRRELDQALVDRDVIEILAAAGQKLRILGSPDARPGIFLVTWLNDGHVAHSPPVVLTGWYTWSAPHPSPPCSALESFIPIIALHTTSHIPTISITSCTS